MAFSLPGGLEQAAALAVSAGTLPCPAKGSLIKIK
jgi:hypothetical protein